MTAGLAAVFAHPDDDAYTIGGTLARHAGRVEVTIVLCTSGGNGPIWEPVATRETLAEVREGEQAAWCRAIGIDAGVEFLRYIDGRLSQVPLDELLGRIERILGDVQPHVVVTFGPEGITRHPDHIRAGEAATEAFHRARSAARSTGTAFQRLYQEALRRSNMDRMYGAGRERHLPLGDQDTLLNPVGVPDEHIAVDVDLADVYDRKIQAIRMHRSQVGELDRFPRDLQPLYLGHECFVQAWPERRPGQAVVGDLFDGIYAGDG